MLLDETPLHNAVYLPQRFAEFCLQLLSLLAWLVWNMGKALPSKPLQQQHKLVEREGQPA